MGFLNHGHGNYPKLDRPLVRTKKVPCSQLREVSYYVWEAKQEYQLETLNNWYLSEGHGQKLQKGEGNMTVRNGK